MQNRGKETMERTLLSTTELLNPLLVIVLAIEGYGDADTGVVLYAFTTFIVIGVFLGGLSGYLSCVG